MVDVCVKMWNFSQVELALSETAHLESSRPAKAEGAAPRRRAAREYLAHMLATATHPGAKTVWGHTDVSKTGNRKRNRKQKTIQT